MRCFRLLAMAATVCETSSLSVHSTSSSVSTTMSSTSTTSRRHPIHKVRGGALELSPDALMMAETLAPKIGIFTSTALYFAPAAAVLNAMKTKEKGDLNPLPLAIMSTSTIAWLTYGLSVRDPYVIWSNIAGAIACIGYVVAILPLLKDVKQLQQTQAVVMAGAAATVIMWSILGLSAASAAKISSTLGLFASALFIILSGSPLSTIRTVFKTKNSGSILGPLMAAQCINTALWSAYGLAVKDRFVWGPNVVVRTVCSGWDRVFSTSCFLTYFLRHRCRDLDSDWFSLR